MRKTIQLELWGRKEGRSQRERHFMRREKVLGQYPTPPAVAEWMVKWPEVLGIPKGAGLDPACGDGVFLKALAEAGFKRVVGFDIDLGALVRAKRSGDFKGALLVCGDALRLGFKIRGKFDFVAGNPPFSAKYGRIRERAVLNEFEVSEGRSSEAVELLFLELFVEATKEGGAFAIILPEGFFSSIPMERARRWLLSKVRPVAVVSLSRRFFRAKTSVLIAQKTRATGKVMLAHAEEERDLDKILGAFTGREDFSQAIWALHSELAETMSPLHFLMQRKAGPSEISPFPLVPLKELLAEIRTGATEYGAKRRFSPRGLPFVSAKTVTPFGVDISRDGRFVRPGGAMDKPRAR
ncbi:MAG TPA: methyltransferase domain-containing protein, partial [Chromatiaceae bacterium]|nr:methyltransferase domain-containing protein [Chromatiaceae bacterium]